MEVIPMEKKPFDIGLAVRRIRKAVKPWPKAALFELAENGFTTTFEQLVACIISIRTYDEVTLPVSRKLFERARTPAEISKLTYEELDALISPSKSDPCHCRTCARGIWGGNSL
jgi:endonuclease-3